MLKLLEIKSQCPDIFDKNKDAEINDLIYYLNIFKKSYRFKQLIKEALLQKFKVIK